MRNAVFTEDAPIPGNKAYSQAVISVDTSTNSAVTIHVSGQIPKNAKTGSIPATIEERVNLCLDHISAILSARTFGLKHVIKTSVFISTSSTSNDDDIKNTLGAQSVGLKARFETVYAAVNKVYLERFEEPRPARSCVGVSYLPFDVDVEIDCIAYSA